MNKITREGMEQSFKEKGIITPKGIVEHEELITEYNHIFATLTHLEHEYLMFLRKKKELRDSYSNSKSWEKVIEKFYITHPEEEDYVIEAFIELVEEMYSIKVTSPQDLNKALQLEEVDFSQAFIKGMDHRYYTALTLAIENGAKYKDLLLMEPKDYNLPETWKKEKNQYIAILWAIALSSYLVLEPNFSILMPDLRTIANDLEAPYSVLMDARNVTNIKPTDRESPIQKRMKVISDKIAGAMGIILKENKDKYLQYFGVETEEPEMEYILKDIQEELYWEFYTGIMALALKDAGRKDKTGVSEIVENDIKKYFSKELESLRMILKGEKRVV